MCDLGKVLISSWPLHARSIPNQLAVYVPSHTFCSLKSV